MILAFMAHPTTSHHYTFRVRNSAAPSCTLMS